MSPGSATSAGNGKWIWLRQLSLSLDRREKTPSPLRRGPATSTTAGKSKHARSLRNRKPEDQKQGSLRRPKLSEKRPSDKYDCWKVAACKESSQPKSGGSKVRISPQPQQFFFPDNSIHFPADHITPEATESSYFDADDHDNTSRPSMLMAYGICTLENQFNSY
ncbi:hypothetical protein E4U09_001523 [Claviceps aff. purpurea]|uniref:Uncharacterized protein n=1 Tax=Claviceps aff. purpurea TaxID=1967640 RepID=A0A9P7QJ60_9HYPO|nr:hypothetical protein E4U09_001523 [Claviceps aff. purpurea]